MSQHTTKAEIPDRPTDREREMRDMILEYERGHEGLSAFCQRHGIKPGTFGWWKSEVRRRRTGRREIGARPSRVQDRERCAMGTTGEVEGVQFVEVIPAPQAAPAAPDRHSATHRHSQIRILVSRGRQIEVAPGFDEETLARTLRVVEMTPC